MKNNVELYFRIFLIIAVLFSSLYNLARFIVGINWNSAKSELKSFLSNQYLFLLEHKETDSPNIKNIKKLLNFCHRIQYVLLVLLLLGIITMAIINLID